MTGKTEDTSFRLPALASDELQKQGYSRKGSESVVGPMPPMGTVVKSDDDLWKIIAWLRSVNPSSAGRRPSHCRAPGREPLICRQQALRFRRAPEHPSRPIAARRAVLDPGSIRASNTRM